MARVRVTAGDLDRLVQIQARSITRDPNTGGEIETWADDGGPIWAAVINLPVQPRETDALQVASYGQLTKIRIRWRSAPIVPETHRIQYGDRIYQVMSTVEIGRMQFVELYCVEWSHE